MKKILGFALMALVGLSVISFVPKVSAVTCTALTQNLSQGMKGTQVTALQQFLKDQKITITVTGTYDTQTIAAVKKWQAAHGIISSGTPATTGYGSVGPKTRAAINANCAGTSATLLRNLKIGDRGT